MSAACGSGRPRGRATSARAWARLGAVGALVVLLAPQFAWAQPAAGDLRDPYPAAAAGWGPVAGRNLYISRWAEDWSALRAAGKAPPLKAMPLGGPMSLTVGAEVRLRYDNFVNGQQVRGNDYGQGLFRGVVGADLRLSPGLRVYAEAATGQVLGRHGASSANFRNEAALQQVFVEARGQAGTSLIGVMVGRQEFADGPRQLISLSDGPNLHRSWNGVRLYLHDRRMRFGAFDLRATRLNRGAFDESVNGGERLQGVNASVALGTGRTGEALFVDPFWIHTDKSELRFQGRTGRDVRDTLGARLWGRRGRMSFDWTLARQTGRFIDRDVDAWGLFATQSMALSRGGWKPRLTLRLDVASGGAAGGKTLSTFNPLYASSSYLGEGQFLGLSNLVMVTPGLTAAPNPRTTVLIEYGLARRFTGDDAAYAGGLRPYAGGQAASDRAIGGLWRVAANWSASDHLALFLGYEYFERGAVLERAGAPSGAYGYAGLTLRY